MIVPGQRFTFTSPYQYGPTRMGDADFAARKGTEAEVVEEIDHSEYDYEEVGPMYRIRFLSDGLVIEAWPEEIDPSLITNA